MNVERKIKIKNKMQCISFCGVVVYLFFFLSSGHSAYFFIVLTHLFYNWHEIKIIAMRQLDVDMDMDSGHAEHK